MTLKRRPPQNNIRRVVPIGNNLRYTITNKADQTVQCESSLERKLTLRFDRDPHIRTYTSQPERVSYLDAEGKSHISIPDFLVWKTTGEVELHEVTGTSQSNHKHLQEQRAAVRSLCKDRGWRYVVHTEATLPQATEEANLLALARYRPTAYANADVTYLIREHFLARPSPVLLDALVTWITQTLPLEQTVLIPALGHLLWHGILETDLRQTLLFQDATLRRDILVWTSKEAL